MSHAADTDAPADESRPALPFALRVGIYALATPIGAAAGVVAAAGPIVGPVVALVAGATAAACTAAIGTTALANARR